jgi:type VI secretion system secreted protein VgrG
MASAKGGQGIEEKLERYQYTPGAFLFGTDQGESTPVADDKGKTRTDEKEAALLAQKRLDAKRGSAKVCTFETNAYDLGPGSVLGIEGHPNEALSAGKSLLVVEASLSGTSHGEWSHHCEARGTEIPFRPELSTARPKVNGVESATVVGRAGEEIHTDEFGRVRVHFHWDRESTMDDGSSCWIPVSQSWGGSGFGGMNLPRVGQEVLVDFLGGDPDRPVIVGRVYTNLQKVPYKLPQNKTQSGWRSSSTGGGGGYNELMFEDAQGKEHLNIQAQKDLTKLVKHNERVTIGNNRQKTVKKNETQRIGEDQKLIVGGNVDAVVKKVKKERVEGDSHLNVKGSSKQKLEGGHSLTVVGDQQAKVSKKYAIDAGKEIHLKSGEKLCIEAMAELTIKTPGGFMKIDASGVTIKGLVVKINSGGSPGSGSGSSPEEPEDAAEPDEHS